MEEVKPKPVSPNRPTEELEDALAKRLTNLFGRIAGIPLIIATIATTLNVISRHFGFPIPDVYDVAGYSMSAVAAFGIVCTALAGAHIVIDLLITRFPRRVTFGFRAIASLISAAMISVIFWTTAKHAMYSVSMREMNTTRDLIVYPFWIIWALGLLLLCIVFLWDVSRAVRTVVSR